MADSLRILLVEDSSVAHNFVKQSLADAEFPATLTWAATNALGLSTLDGGGFDCVLLDHSLPDGNSFDFLKSARERGTLTCPVVILTANSDPATALAAVRNGAEDYLVKGKFDDALLSRTIRYAIERHRFKRDLDLANKRLERLTLVDPLTDILNRRGLQEALTRECKFSQRTGEQLVAILVDLDNFKSVNDTFGHAAGDVVLQEIAARIKHSVRATDYVGRLGGDEFMLLLPSTNPAEGALVAEKVRLAVVSGAISVAQTESVRVSASLGIAGDIESSPSIDALLARTHGFLAQSKRSGKNRVTGGHPTVPGQPAASEGLRGVLSVLGGSRPFIAVQQPIVSLPGCGVVGCELLARLKMSEFSSPAVFFGIARDNRLTIDVDLKCFEACVRASALLQPDQRCHVNILPSTLLSTPADYFVETIAAHGNGGGYCLELSEQEVVGDPSHLVKIATVLRKAGILLAIDDVGFGRSCVESLVLLDPDVIKIDKRLVTGVASDKIQLNALRRLLAVSNSLDVEIIAEGVESASDLTVLNDLGVPFAQGYFLGVPLPCPDGEPASPSLPEPASPRAPSGRPRRRRAQEPKNRS
jgi:diguanylate cyclase (GGDEF)-like protein